MKFFCIFILMVSMSAHAAIISDTVYRAYPWQMMIAAGYTYNTVGGTMVDFNQKFNEILGTHAEQTDNGGFQVNLSIKKGFGGYYYAKSGIGYIHKQVNPQKYSYPLYKDSLNTSYLSVPVLIGFKLPMDQRNTASFFCETGIAGNIRVSDKSYKAPDRVGFEVIPLALDFQAAAGFDLTLSPNASIVFQYTYTSDLTGAYKETLYLGATNQTYFEGYYKYHTSTFSLGIQWGL
jgi:hypothetical protein